MIDCTPTLPARLKRWLYTVVGAFTIFSPAGTNPAVSEEATPEQGQEIERLIGQLGGETLIGRESASQALRKIGRPCIAALKLAMENPDAEVRTRAQNLLFHLEPETRPRSSFNIDSINGDEGIVLLKGGYKKILIGNINGKGVVESEDIDADEIWIGGLNGEGRVVLKGKVNKLRIGGLNGEARIDATGLSAGEIEVREMNGSAAVQLRATGEVRFTGTLNGSSSATVETEGDIFINSAAGGSRITVSLCRNLEIAGEVRDGAAIEANHFGEVKGAIPGRTNLRLSKVGPPK